MLALFLLLLMACDNARSVKGHAISEISIPYFSGSVGTSCIEYQDGNLNSVSGIFVRELHDQRPVSILILKCDELYRDYSIADGKERYGYLEVLNSPGSDLPEEGLVACFANKADGDETGDESPAVVRVHHCVEITSIMKIDRITPRKPVSRLDFIRE